MNHIEKREAAILWWKRLTFEQQFYKVIAWLKSKGQDVTSRHPDAVTGREVQEIWEMETF